MCADSGAAEGEGVSFSSINSRINSVRLRPLDTKKTWILCSYGLGTEVQFLNRNSFSMLKQRSRRCPLCCARVRYYNPGPAILATFLRVCHILQDIFWLTSPSSAIGVAEVRPSGQTV